MVIATTVEGMCIEVNLKAKRKKTGEVY